MNNTDKEIKAQLINAAKAHAEYKGWAWIEPVEATPASTLPGEETWTIRTNVGSLGRSVRVLIKESDKEIIESGFMRR